MKTDESESCSKNTNNEKEKKDDQTSDENKELPKSFQAVEALDLIKDDSSSSKDDSLFEPTVDMLVNDFDEEQTLEEEEMLAAKEQIDPGEEISDLQRESEMPIEELLKLYGYGSSGPPALSSSSRKRRRRQDKTAPTTSNSNLNCSSSSNNSKKGIQEVPNEESALLSAQSQEDIADNSGDEDAATTTTTNNLENQSIDDETNYEEEEPSELKKLYTGLYSTNEGKDGEKLDGTISDEDEDLDYIPDEEDGKKTIMVGLDYQAVIPEGLLKYDDVLPYENEDKLLWDPSKVNEEDIEDYLTKFSTAINGGTNNHNNSTPPASQSNIAKHLRDDELALLLLVQCGNNIEEALRRRRLGAVQPTNTMSIWSEEECRNFENGLRLYGKSFHEIQASKVT